MHEDFKKVWTTLIIKAWQDPQFKKQLLADPTACFKEAGCEIPNDFSVKIVENSEKNIHLILPTKPSGALSEKQLHEIAAGGYLTNLWM